MTMIETLVALVRGLRPDWDAAGVQAALERTVKENPNASPAQVSAAAVKAAGVLTNRTPAVIAMSGAHWREPPAAAYSLARPRSERRYPCGRRDCLCTHEMPCESGWIEVRAAGAAGHASVRKCPSCHPESRL